MVTHPITRGTLATKEEPASIYLPRAGIADLDLSVVIPCFRSAPQALTSVARLRAVFAGSSLSWEAIVVDDGGGDFDEEAWSDADDLCGAGRVRLLRLPRNMGKGAAVRAGMLAARGRVRIFTDVDLPYDPQLFFVIAEYICERGFHVVIGDRTLPDSSYHMDIGWRRRLASGFYSFLVGRFVTGGFFDTQCGLKGFRGDVAEALFSRSRIERFAFDVEIIYLALLHRLDIKRVPVRLCNNETSSVRLLCDSTRMLVDTLMIKRHQMNGDYCSAELQGIVTQDFTSLAQDVQDAKR